VYHNTFLRREPVWRDYFLFGLGAVSLRNTERDVFNNLFVQADRVPGAVILGQAAGPLREGGNLLWGVKEGPTKTTITWNRSSCGSPTSGIKRHILRRTRKAARDISSGRIVTGQRWPS
jgi:hypothetical protein